MIMSDDVVYRNLKVYKTLVARLLKKFRFEKKINIIQKNLCISKIQAEEIVFLLTL